LISAPCWSARALSQDSSRPIEGSVCDTVWPTRALNSDERWFRFGQGSAVGPAYAPITDVPSATSVFGETRTGATLLV